MELTLNVWQRAMVLAIVSQARGNLRMLRLALRVLEVWGWWGGGRSFGGLRPRRRGWNIQWSWGDGS
jgi:hypothetical protein